jgi:tripartite-type tricarboxylate transporter receptor subunit TctC
VKSLQDRFETLSLEASRMDRPTLRRYIDGEVTKWGRLVKELGVKVQ